MNLRILFAAFLVGSVVISPVFGQKKPSWFKEDKNGVLWFQKGDDGETKYSSSLILSAVTDGIVITVVANEQYMDKAVQLAIKMRDALQSRKDTPDRIPVVAYKSSSVKGIGYKFYTDGAGYGAEDLTNKGSYSPAEAKKALRGVIMQYNILKEDVEKGKWGHENKHRKALKIRRQN